MYPCLDCGFAARSPAGLASHRRQRHHVLAVGPNRRAAEKTLSILRQLGRIEDIDAVRVQTIRSLADALDADASNAQMWRTYREAVEDLLRMDDVADSSLEAALAKIRSAGPLGDAPEA